MKSVKAWRKYCKSGNKPVDIPYNPDREYKTEWASWGDWLGTANVASKKKKYLSFMQAQKIVRSLELKGRKEFKAYMKKARPLGIPSEPWRAYKEWNGMNDWLGTETRYGNRKFLPFEDARECVRKLELKTSKEWREYCRSGNTNQSSQKIQKRLD
ncbi:MAG: hypothetical protein WAM14_23645 [Candidatus Nitrosopolaris sp.]